MEGSIRKPCVTADIILVAAGANGNALLRVQVSVRFYAVRVMAVGTVGSVLFAMGRVLIKVKDLFVTVDADTIADLLG
jgi:hypothetical protein